MPQDLHLTREQERWYNRALVSGADYTVTAELLDRDRKVLAAVGHIQDGQVNLDATRSDSSIWSCTMTVDDENNRLALDSNLLFLDRILRVKWSVYVPQMGRRVPAILFCGPCTKVDAEGPLLYFEAQGMEVWARGAIRKSRTWKKGAQVTDVIRQIWRDEIGEPAKWLDIPNLPDRLPANYQAKLDVSWWDAIQYLAGSINCDAFYSRDSTGRLRRRGAQAVYVLHGGDGAIVSEPQSSALLGGGTGDGSFQSIRNRFVVVGKAKPVKPPKDPPPHYHPPKPPAIIGIWNVPKGNPQSAVSLGHPGTPLWLKDVYNNDHIRTKATAARIARFRGRRAMQLVQQVALETVVVPHLDPFDSYQVETKRVKGRFEFVQSSVPFIWSVDNPMTWGFTRRVSAMRRRRRR